MSRPVQSALQPADGSAAAFIDSLGMVMYVGGGAILFVVLALALYGVFGRPRVVSVRHWVIGGGLLFPAITLSALLVYSLAIGNGLAAIGTSNALQLFLDCFSGDARPQQDADLLRVHVVGKQWWWEVRYERANGVDAITANELHLPTDRPVELVLSTTDVIHSFWMPSLAGKVDMIPGRTTRLRVQTSEAGTFRGLCAEYCGGQHALMAFVVVTRPPAEFAAWLDAQARPAQLSDIGYGLFLKGNCQACHTIRGTPANGAAGPDLTHVGGRRMLAAGVLDNHIGTMAGWIAGAQDVKPGNAMPSASIYTGEELRALAAWLGSLE